MVTLQPSKVQPAQPRSQAPLGNEVNLHDDLGEAHNLAETMPPKVAELNTLLDKFLAQSGAIVRETLGCQNAGPFTGA